MAIHFNGQTIFSIAHIEGITVGAGEEVNEVAGGASGMDVEFFLSLISPCPMVEQCNS